MSNPPYKNSFRYVYGKNSVKAVLDTQPETVSKLFISSTLKPDKRIYAIQLIANQYKIPIQQAPRQKLDTMLSSEINKSDPTEDAILTEDTVLPNHQGIIAAVAPKALLELHDIIELSQKKKETGQNPIILLLDGVLDARNFGAILRVSDAAGVTGVIIPRHNSVGFSPGVSKTASGAEETVPVAMVSNLSQAIDTLKTHDFWVYGTAVSGETSVYHQQNYNTPVALVMGSEEKGLSPKIQKHCDILIRIPMLGMLESLNVSTATAVFLYEVVRQQSVKKAKQ